MTFRQQFDLKNYLYLKQLIFKNLWTQGASWKLSHN